MSLPWPWGCSLPLPALKKHQTDSTKSPHLFKDHGWWGSSLVLALYNLLIVTVLLGLMPPLCLIFWTHFCVPSCHCHGSATLTLLLGESLSHSRRLIPASFSHAYIISFILSLLGRTSWARSVIKQESFYLAGISNVQTNIIK